MTFRLVAFGLFEAGTLDIRGQISMIGLMSDHLQVELPAQLAPVLCLVLEREERGPVQADGPMIDVTVQAIEPGGEVAFFNRQSVPLGQAVDPRQRHRIQAVLPVPTLFRSEGTYIYRMTVSVPLTDSERQTFELERDLLITTA